MNNSYIIDISSIFFIIFLFGTIAESTIRSTLDWMNSKNGNISEKIKSLHAIHPLMKKYFSRNKITKAIEYNREISSFEDFTASVTNGITMVLFIFGIPPMFLNTIVNLIPNVSTTIHYIIFTSTLLIIKNAIYLPFARYETFEIDGRYGFNKTTNATFYSDAIKSLVVGISLSSIVIAITNHFLTKLGPFSSVMTCMFVAGIILTGVVVEFFVMTIGLRMFNKLTPLKDRNLSRRIKDLLVKYGYDPNIVYVMDASKRSTKVNAFIGGIWKSRKIVLYDTLLKKYTNDEIISILGHELAHGKLNHLFLNRVLSFAMTLITIFIVFSITYDIRLYHAFGFRFVTENNMIQYSLIGFVLSTMMVNSIKWVVDPVFSLISRKCEYAADRYSIKYTKNKNAMISSLIKLTSENLGDVFPDGSYEMWNYDHPSITNRISAILHEDVNKTKHKKSINIENQKQYKPPAKNRKK